MKKVWKLRTVPGDYQKLGKELGISSVVARCIRNRNKEDVDNLVTAEQMAHYLDDTPDDLHDPLQMKGVREAVGLLKGMLDAAGGSGSGAGLAIASDYDCDGICSGLVLKKGLTRAGFETKIYTPDRLTEGYGLNRRIVDEALQDGFMCLMTCDNGIAAMDGVTYAKDKGMTVIVTDHHEPQEELPPADVIIDPKQEGETYPFDGLCGAGVAYKLITQLYRELGMAGDGSATTSTGSVAGSAGEVDATDFLMHELLELTAIATVADVMELIDENRIIVKYGLLSLRNTDNPGLRSLLCKLRLDDKALDGSDIGFRVGPTLNVAGRIAKVEDAFALLETADAKEADKRAEMLVELNDKRKQMTEAGMKQALDDLQATFPELDRDEMDDVLVVCLPGVHESLAGLIAGRIKERFNHPAIVFTEGAGGDSDNAETTTEKTELLRGSGRSIAPYDMFEHLMDCKDLTEKFGGHKMAAGLTIQKANLEPLRERLNKESGLCAEDFVPELLIDLEVPISYISEKLIGEIDRMMPFGVANLRPVFAQRSLRITHIRYMGAENQHLKLFVKDDKGVQLEALAFSRAAEFDKEVTDTYGSQELENLRTGNSPHTITIAYQPSINEYNGYRTVQLQLIDWVFDA